jgi:hypothetical protein
LSCTHKNKTGRTGGRNEERKEGRKEGRKREERKNGRKNKNSLIKDDLILIFQNSHVNVKTKTALLKTT